MPPADQPLSALSVGATPLETGLVVASIGDPLTLSALSVGATPLETMRRLPRCKESVNFQPSQLGQPLWKLLVSP